MLHLGFKTEHYYRRMSKKNSTMSYSMFSDI